MTTLAGALEGGAVAGRVDLRRGSWGAGKDWHTWDGPQVRDLVDDHAALQREVLAVVDARPDRCAPDAAYDQLVRSLLLALASDWAFMVTKDSAAEYARRRHGEHLAATRRLARLLAGGQHDEALVEAAAQRSTDGPFQHLDARIL